MILKQHNSRWLQDALAMKAITIHGSNQGLIAAHAKRLCRAVIADESDDAFQLVLLATHEFKKNNYDLLAEAQSLALNGHKRLIWLKDGGDFLTKTIKELASIDTDTNVVIITCPQLTKKSSLRQLCETADNLALLACYDETDLSVQAYSDSVVKKYHKTLSARARALLSQHFATERYELQHQLEKIILYSGNNDLISEDDCAAVITPPTTLQTHQIAFAVGLGDSAKLTQLLHHAKEQALPMPTIIRATVNHFIRLYQCLAQIEEGSNVQQALKRLRPPLFFKDEPLFRKQLRLWQADSILEAITILSEGEIISKQNALTAKTHSQHKLFTVAHFLHHAVS